MSALPEATIRADERDRCRAEARRHPGGVCPCCGRQDVAEMQRVIRSKEAQIQALMRGARDA